MRNGRDKVLLLWWYCRHHNRTVNKMEYGELTPLSGPGELTPLSGPFIWTLSRWRSRVFFLPKDIPPEIQRQWQSSKTGSRIFQRLPVLFHFALKQSVFVSNSDVLQLYFPVGVAAFHFHIVMLLSTSVIITCSGLMLPPIGPADSLCNWAVEQPNNSDIAIDAPIGF